LYDIYKYIRKYNFFYIGRSDIFYLLLEKVLMFDMLFKNNKYGRQCWDQLEEILIIVIVINLEKMLINWHCNWLQEKKLISCNWEKN